VYRRASLSRTVVLVGALLLAAVSTGAFAREFRSPDPHYDRHPIGALPSDRLGAEKRGLDPIKTGAADRNRTIVALIVAMTPVLIARLCRVEWI
jgi:hypothetical protein